MVELIVYPRAQKPQLINNSPFCSKTEIFLRINNIDHKVTDFNGNPAKFANSKLPVIQHKGQTIVDSSWIQKYLEREFNIDMDSHLSDAERAQGFAFAKMAEEYLYWSILHERWFIDENWFRLRSMYFGHMPGLLRGFLSNMIRNSLKKSAVGHGMSRHSDTDIHTMGQECIKAFSDFIGDRPFLLGEKVSSYDTSIYAFVSSALHSDLGPKLTEEVLKYENLIEYDKRMFKLVYKEKH